MVYSNNIFKPLALLLPSQNFALTLILASLVKLNIPYPYTLVSLFT